MENERDALMQKTTRIHLAMEAKETLRRMEEFPDNPSAMGYFYDFFRTLFTDEPVLPEAKKVIGTMCVQVPDELIYAAGAVPFRLCSGAFAYDQIGADFMRRYKENEIVINAIESHHGDVPMISPYPVLVQAADAISGARPGARREPLEAYIKRLTQLEELADSFKGVSKAYAIQAGREIRVIVENETIDDLASSILSADIARKIENEMQYPGQIKVTVIRETRSTEFAK